MKTCRHCAKEFQPARPLQAVCSAVCATRKARADSAAKRAQERTQTRVRREALKTIADRIREAQKEFNAYIRLRDHDQPCICCGHSLGAGDIGGRFDAGHYRSTGSAAHLRFDERNCHGQRKACNRYGAGRAVDYRLGLISRIGLAEVEALEADNRSHKWTHEELISIRALYRAKRKHLDALRATGVTA